MDPSDWDDFINYSFNDQNASLDFSWPEQSGSADNDISSTGVVPQENENTRKRARSDSCSRPGSKACREKLRRERLNDRFLDLSCILEPGRPARTDKPAILDDAIRVLNQLRTESQELKETNEKLQEEIKSLKSENKFQKKKFKACLTVELGTSIEVNLYGKDVELDCLGMVYCTANFVTQSNSQAMEFYYKQAEKNELREEKLILKADKEKLEQQLKVMAMPTGGYMPTHPAAYHAGLNKMAVYPSYGLMPMWQYLPPSLHDTSRDHELRPPAA
ncbi:hypothetical protein WN943_029046 [Citrus x changshan-huyou]